MKPMPNCVAMNISELHTFVRSPTNTTLQSLQGAALGQVLAHREQVADDLRGMVVVGEPVDDGHLAVARELHDRLVLERTRLDHVAHPREHLGRVVERLAHAEVDLAGLEVERVAAELGHRHLEGDAGARGGLLEDHPQRAVVEQQRHSRVAVGVLEQADQPDQLLEFLAAEFLGIDEVPHAC
jgi:hypothetical protein